MCRGVSNCNSSWFSLCNFFKKCFLCFPEPIHWVNLYRWVLGHLHVVPKVCSVSKRSTYLITVWRFCPKFVNFHVWRLCSWQDAPDVIIIVLSNNCSMTDEWNEICEVSVTKRNEVLMCVCVCCIMMSVQSYCAGSNHVPISVGHKHDYNII